MTKKEFLNGDIFFVGNDKGESYKFTKSDSPKAELGYISIKRRYDDSFKYYANVSKLNSSSVSMYFFGLQKMHKERIMLKNLEKRLPL